MRGHNTASILATAHARPTTDSDVSCSQPHPRQCGVACMDWLKFSPVLSLLVRVAGTDCQARETSMIRSVLFKLGLQIASAC